MPAYPRPISPVPAPSSSAAPVPTASPSIPATSEHEHSSPEPYWPRLARALILLFLAVSLHVWGVRSPEPQEPVYAMLASRLVTSVLVSPPLPLAPPLRPIMSQRWSAGRRVTIQTSILNVPPVPGPPVSSPAVDPRLVAVGTSGTTIGWATDTPDVAPRLAPAAPPARATLEDLAGTRGVHRVQARADDRGLYDDRPAARASNPVHRSVPGSPRVVRKPCCAPCRSERSGPDRSGGRAGPSDRRSSSPWCANTRARSNGSTSMPPRRSIHPSTIAGFGDRSRMSRHSGSSWPPAACPFPHRDAAPTRGVLAIRRSGPKLDRESSDTRIRCGSST